MRPALVVCLALAFGLGAAAPALARPAAEDGNHTVTLVTDDVNVPVAMAFIGPDTFFVLEKDLGRVQLFTAGVKTQELDLAVNRCGERGLLGIAVHPDFAAAMDPKPYVYFYYTPSTSMTADIDDCNVAAPNQVDRYTWNGTAFVPMSKTPILTLPGDKSFHNGGTLAFGPDKKLYGVVGDGDRNGQLQNNAAGAPPDDSSIIFRVNDDGSLPTDNPLDADADRLDPEDKIFAYGIRNSFGLAFDPANGRLWDSENGPQAFDEINLVAPGFNSGWRDVMGPAPSLPPPGLFEPPGSAYADPAYAIASPVALTGVAFATSNTSLGSEYVDDLFVADFNLGQIYRFELNGLRSAIDLPDLVADNQNELNQHRFASGFSDGISDLEEGPDGALYVVNIGANAIYKIEGEGGPVVHDLALASLKAPTRVTIPMGGSSVRTLAVTIVNAGTATETVDDPSELGNLVTVTGTALTGGCPTAPTPVLVPPKTPPPFALPPRKKLKLAYTLEFDCASAMATDVEFEWDAAVDLSALGSTDSAAANDVCPRAPSGTDKGCGGKPAGSPIRTDVSVK